MATVSLFFTACEDGVSGIGNSISSAEVTINVDSLTYNLLANTIEAPSFESRSAYNLLGSIRVPEYGALDCSYVTQFMPAENLNLPDSITSAEIDSVKLILTVPKAYVTGDTLAPQQMKVYALNRQLPSDISSDFNPDGYYDKSNPLAVKSYTLSGYEYNDSTYKSSASIKLKTLLPDDYGLAMVKKYESDPEVFVWPQEFAKYWPGVYISPSFGKGCIAPVYSTDIFAYFPKTVTNTETDADGKIVVSTYQVADSVCIATSAPEVISNINIDYRPSDSLEQMISEGKNIITTPGGYAVKLTFPAKDILHDYWGEEYNLGVINNMVFSIPAKIITNSYGIGMPPALLLVKATEADTFFEEGRLPDNKTSFFSLYSATDGAYTFSSMREYIVALKQKGEDQIDNEDVEFVLIPVTVQTEDYTDPSTYTTVTAVTSIAPYTLMPSMVELETERALIVFTYSNQTIF